MEAIRAHITALDPFLDEEVTGFEFDLLIGRDCTDQRRQTARREAIDTLLQYLRVADRVERVFDTATAQPFDFADRVGGGTVDGVGSAKVFGDLELVIANVHRDDLTRPGDSRALDYRDSDATRAENRDRRSRGDLRSIECGADAGSDGTSEQGGTV